MRKILEKGEKNIKQCHNKNNNKFPRLKIMSIILSCIFLFLKAQLFFVIVILI